MNSLSGYLEQQLVRQINMLLLYCSPALSMLLGESTMIVLSTRHSAKMAAIKMAAGLGVSQTSAPCGLDPLAPLLELLKIRTWLPILPQRLSNNSLCWASPGQCNHTSCNHNPSKIYFIFMSHLCLSVFKCLFWKHWNNLLEKKN